MGLRFSPNGRSYGMAPDDVEGFT